VKYLGRDDTDYMAIVESLGSSTVVQTEDLCGAVNYVLFRAYEAAKQLQRVEGHRIVLYVVDDLTWHKIQVQLKNGWVDWSNPRFFDASERWRAPAA